MIAVREADKARSPSPSCDRNWILPCLALLTLALAACSPYSFTGGGKAIVPSVAVRLFDNETEQFGIAEKLTEGLVDGFVEDNHVKVLDATRAKAILEGTIKEYGRTAYTFDDNDRVTEYIVEITISMRLADSEPDGKVHWETDATRGFGVYNADTESETDGQDRAIEKITEDALNRTIKSW